MSIHSLLLNNLARRSMHYSIVTTKTQKTRNARTQVLTDSNSIQALREHLLASDQQNWEANQTKERHETIVAKLRGFIYDVAVLRGIYDREATKQLSEIVSASEIRCARSLLEAEGDLNECALLLLDNNPDRYQNIKSKILLGRDIEDYENVDEVSSTRSLIDDLYKSFLVCTKCYDHVDIPYQSKRPRRPRDRSKKKDVTSVVKDEEKAKEQTWDAESVNQLISLVMTHGMHWPKIGSIMNRDSQSCYAKYKTIVQSSGNLILHATDSTKKSMKDFVQGAEQIQERNRSITTTTTTSNKKRKSSSSERTKSFYLDTTTLALYGYYATELHFKRGYVEETVEKGISQLARKILKSYSPRIFKNKRASSSNGEITSSKPYSSQETTTLVRLIEEWPKNEKFTWDSVASRYNEIEKSYRRVGNSLRKRFLRVTSKEKRAFTIHESNERFAVALSLAEIVNAVSSERTSLLTNSRDTKKGGPWTEEDDERLDIYLASFGDVKRSRDVLRYMGRSHPPCVARILRRNEQVQNDSTQMTDLDVMNHVRNLFEIQLKPAKKRVKKRVRGDEAKEHTEIKKKKKEDEDDDDLQSKRFTDTRTHQTMEYVYNFETGILSKWIVRSVITRMPNYSIAIERLKYEY